MEYVGTKLCL